MIQRAEILNKLKLSKSELSWFGVVRIGLFGSVNRDESTKDSDVDILIDFNSESETYENFINVCSFLESIFKGSKLDIVTEKGLSPFIGPDILKEVQYA